MPRRAPPGLVDMRAAHPLSEATRRATASLQVSGMRGNMKAPWAKIAQHLPSEQGRALCAAQVKRLLDKATAAEAKRPKEASSIWMRAVNDLDRMLRAAPELAATIGPALQAAAAQLDVCVARAKITLPESY